MSAVQPFDDYPDRLNQMRTWFQTGATQEYAFRKKILKRLIHALDAEEENIYQALYQDLHKSAEECQVTEIGLLRQELKHTLAELRNWMQPSRVRTNLLNQPSSSHIVPSPRGVVLVIGTWNFPLQLLLIPMVNALAAGNCVVLKPSEHAPATERWLQSFIPAHFPPELVTLVTGDGAEVVPAMMKQFRFDYIFYTGSTAVGKQIYELAASQLVPVTLELGGKDPCIVEADASLAVASRRIVAAKFANAGQMCVSPDYLLVHHSVKDRLVDFLKKDIAAFYSGDPASDKGYGRIINTRNFDRLLQLLPQGNLIFGGQHNRESLFFGPTLLENPSPDSNLMREEIFGPLLPILVFHNREEAMAIIRRNPNPLSFYIFTSSRASEEFWIRNLPFGNGCINNAAWQFTNQYLPFGGIGQSGIGAYHGRFGFDTFSHRKGILKTPTWFDPKIKYPPLQGRLKLLKWLFR